MKNYKAFKRKFTVAWGYNKGFYFFGITPNTWPIKGKFGNLDFVKTKIFCSAKETIKKMKTWAIDWDNIFANCISN